jgi:predicted ATPase
MFSGSTRFFLCPFVFFAAINQKKVPYTFQTAPFLRTIRYSAPTPSRADFPFSIPLFKKSFNLELAKPITIIVGENGTGKSTLLESLAAKCRFSIHGGNRNHVFDDPDDPDKNKTPLDDFIQLSWSHKVTWGFFLRAETFTNFASTIDDLGAQYAYGGKSLHEQSHGESFLALFQNRFNLQGIYILDEPEAALSPVRQLAFLKILRDMETSTHMQLIIATHSPILLSYPGAQVLSIENGRLKEVNYADTEHFTVTRDFLQNPGRFFKHLFDQP